MIRRETATENLVETTDAGADARLGRCRGRRGWPLGLAQTNPIEDWEELAGILNLQAAGEGATERTTGAARSCATAGAD